MKQSTDNGVDFELQELNNKIIKNQKQQIELLLKHIKSKENEIEKLLKLKK